MSVPLLDIATIAAGEGKVVSAHQGIRFTMIPGSGGTMSYSRVDSPDASAHGADETSVSAHTTVDVDWPYFYVTAATADGRVALV